MKIRNIEKTIQPLFAVFLVFIAWRLVSYHFSLITYPYANTLREGTMMTSTAAFASGINPFAFEQQPRYANVYGVMYPLFVLPLTKIFGVTMIVHRSVTALFMFGSMALLWISLQRLAVPLLLNVFCCLMFYSCLLYPGTSTPTIDPGSMCTFFYLATILLPWYDNYSKKSLMISVILGIIAFYTKPYAMLGLPVMASFLFLFVDKHKAIWYGTCALAAGVLSIVCVNYLFPAYFDNCFFASVNMSKAWSQMDRLIMQLKMFGQIHLWLLCAFAISLAYGIVKKINIANRLNIFIYSAFCAGLVLVLFLGKHTGATLWYFFQLFSPFMLVIITIILGRTKIWTCCIPLLALTLYNACAEEKTDIFLEKNENWKEVKALISQHRTILNSSIIVPILIEQNKEFFDNGQAEYVLPGGDRTGIMGAVLKEDPRVKEQMSKFFLWLKLKTVNKDFDLILLQPNLLPFISDDIRANYISYGNFELYAPQDRRPYALSVWLPKQKVQ